MTYLHLGWGFLGQHPCPARPLATLLRGGDESSSEGAFVQRNGACSAPLLISLASVGPLRDNSCLLQPSAKPGGAGCTPSVKAVGNLIWGCNTRSAWWPLTHAGSSSKAHAPSAALFSAEARRALLRTPRRGTKRLDEAGLGLL